MRTLFLLWRRQDGKSYTLGAWALRRMMELPGHLVVLCSASVSIGKEFAVKEAAVWLQFTQAYRDLLKRQGTPERIVTTADDDKGSLLDLDAVADLFEHQRLETRILHGHTTVSRSVVVAPNPDTAVGWTGDVVMDEVGRIDVLKDLLEALGPIMTRNRQYMMRMATTISPDAAHYSRQIHGLPADHPGFATKAEGTYYTSKSGYLVHRHDAWDAQAGGAKLYDDKTGAEVTPEQHRAAALDKDAWDRNYWMKEVIGGSAAIPAPVLTRCLAQGKGKCVGIDLPREFSFKEIPQLIPPTWVDLIDRGARKLGMGYDIATTTQKRSNPSSITLAQRVGLQYFARLVLRFKTADPAVARAIIDHLLLCLPEGMRVRALCIDASNERYFAVETRKYLAGRLPVRLIVSGETTNYLGETITNKALICGRCVETASDGYLALPPCDWIENDWRLVKIDKGLYYADVDESGAHGDTFDGTRLALHAIDDAGGPVSAEATSLLSGSGSKSPRRGRGQLFPPPNPTTSLHV